MIMKDHCAMLEAIVRHVGHSQVIKAPYLFEKISKNTDEQTSLDVMQFYLAVIYYFKASLIAKTNPDWLERVGYDLNYSNYHADLALQKGTITNKEYHDRLFRSYETAIFKYIRLAGRKPDDNEAVTLAILSMTDDTAQQLGYAERFTNLENDELPRPYTKRIHKRIAHYATPLPPSPPNAEASSAVPPEIEASEDDVVVI